MSANLNSTFINTAVTTQVKTGRGSFVRLIVGTTAAGAITVYDNTSAAGTVLLELKTSIAEGVYEVDCRFQIGLCVVTAAASHISVVWE